MKNNFFPVGTHNGKDLLLYISPVYRQDEKNTTIRSFTPTIINRLIKSGMSCLIPVTSKIYAYEPNKKFGFLFHFIENSEIPDTALLCLRHGMNKWSGKSSTKYTRIFNQIDGRNDNFLAYYTEQSKTDIVNEYTEWKTTEDSHQSEEEKKRIREKQEELLNLSAWIDRLKMQLNFKFFETEEWKEFSLEPRTKALYAIIFSLFQDIDKERVDPEFNEIGDRVLYVVKKDNVCLLYEDIMLEETGKSAILMLDGEIGEYEDEDEDPKTGELIPVYSFSKIEKLLETIESDYNMKSEDELPGSTNFNFTVNDGVYLLSEISRAGSRAYSNSILKQQNQPIWIKIQEEDKDSSNLSLLPDQTQLLSEFNPPIFINGQAGSGKTTMLYYIYAEIVKIKLMENEPKEKIIFLTESQSLSHTSRREIANLLYLNPKFSSDMRKKYKGRKEDEILNLIVGDIAKYFFTFKEFLRDKLEEANERFPHDKFLNFFKFKEFYNNSSGNLSIIRSKYSAETAWYVIRTFIKGYLIEKEEMTVKDFEEIPRDDKGFINKDAFKEIYEKVYKNFYKGLTTVNAKGKDNPEKGWWDYLDLVKYLLKTKSGFKEYAMIFCDEAQDFTKLELQVLIQYSKLADNYQMEYFHQFPVVFAGDPFQTVNPTGFSWTRLKSMFDEDILKKYSLNIEVNECIKELKMNYRSSKAIVKLANSIQYFRKIFLDGTDLKFPQEARDQGLGEIPEMYEVEKNISELPGIDAEIIIANCELDGEKQFKENDGLDVELYIVNSPALLKGREMDTIVLYKFGDWFVSEFFQKNSKTKGAKNKKSENLLDLCNALLNEDSNKNHDLNFRLSYFFNKFYVAVTRARKKLYIVDTKSGIENFWNPLQEIITANLKRERKPEAHEKETENWRYMLFEKNMPTTKFWEQKEEYHQKYEGGEKIRDGLNKALAAKADGIAQENQDLLNKIAIPFFLKTKTEGYENDINECRAYSFMFGAEYRNAAEKFLVTERVSLKKLALDCFLFAGDSLSFQDLIRNSDENSAHYFVAKFMAENYFDEPKFRLLASEINELLVIDKTWWRKIFTSKLGAHLNKNRIKYTGLSLDIIASLKKSRQKITT